MCQFAKNDRRHLEDQDLNLMWFPWKILTKTPGHGAGSNSAIAPASHAAATSVLHLGAAMVFMRECTPTNSFIPKL